MIIFSLTVFFIVCLFIFSLVQLRRTNEGRRHRWLLLSALCGTLLIVISLSVWKGMEFFSLGRRVEIGVPIDASAMQGELHVHFVVPAGPYRVVANLEGEPQAEEDVGRIRYHLKVPKQGIDVNQEADINWGLRVSQNRLANGSFEIREHASEGTLSVEALKPTKRKFRVELVSARQLDM